MLLHANFKMKLIHLRVLNESTSSWFEKIRKMYLPFLAMGREAVFRNHMEYRNELSSVD